MIPTTKRVLAVLCLTVLLSAPIAQAGDGMPNGGWITSLFDQLLEWVVNLGNADQPDQGPEMSIESAGPQALSESGGGGPECGEAGPIADPGLPQCGG